VLPILLISLLLTLLLEIPVAWMWGLRNRYNLKVAILVNILTNPAVVLLSSMGFPQLLLEAAAIAVEALCYCCCGRNIHRPILLAVVANVFSYSVGCLWNLFF